MKYEEFETITHPDVDEMLWFAGRCWWFPGAQIGAGSEFEWRGDGVFVLQPDNRAVEGIVFAGKIAPD